MKNLRSYVELAKPRILSMVLVTTTIGFFLAAKGIHPLFTLLVTLFGVGCATGGSAALNNYLERDVDGKMERTRHRALPAEPSSPPTRSPLGSAWC